MRDEFIGFDPGVRGLPITNERGGSDNDKKGNQSLQVQKMTAEGEEDKRDNRMEGKQLVVGGAIGFVVRTLLESWIRIKSPNRQVCHFIGTAESQVK